MIGVGLGVLVLWKPLEVSPSIFEPEGCWEVSGGSGNGSSLFSNEYKSGDTGRRRAKEEKMVNMLNEKGFGKGGAIPSTHCEFGGLASFQLQLIVSPAP